MVALWCITKHMHNSAVKKSIVNMNFILYSRKLKNKVSATDINPGALILEFSASSIIPHYLTITFILVMH